MPRFTPPHAVAAFLAAALMPASINAQPAGETYILAGQSNMSGRGQLETLTSEERTPDAAIRLFGNDGQWRVAAEPLDLATNQIDEVSADRQAAVGPGLFFARRLRASGAAQVSLVPCAKGGSSIARWKDGGGRESLYGSCLARARDAGGRIAGVLWYQGETDAEKANAAPAWRAAFENLVKALRRDLGNERLPIVIVQLADAPPEREGAKRFSSWAAIQAAQAQSPPSCVAVVSAKGLSKREDNLHLDTAGQRALGPKLADAMRDLQTRGCR